jgi:hypothetical protein
VVKVRSPVRNLRIMTTAVLIALAAYSGVSAS